LDYLVLNPEILSSSDPSMASLMSDDVFVSRLIEKIPVCPKLLTVNSPKIQLLKSDDQFVSNLVCQNTDVLLYLGNEDRILRHINDLVKSSPLCIGKLLGTLEKLCSERADFDELDIGVDFDETFGTGWIIRKYPKICEQAKLIENAGIISLLYSQG